MYSVDRYVALSPVGVMIYEHISEKTIQKDGPWQTVEHRLSKDADNWFTRG